MGRGKLLAGLSLSTCLLAAGGTGAEPVTFNKDVAPILQKNCQGCHRPGEAAPMPLLTYQQVRPWAKAIREAVLLKRMPPWFADPEERGRFSNDWSLSRSDIETLVAWSDTGAREGDPKDLPPPRQFVEGWNIGRPDAVFEMPNEFRVPAAGTIEYQYVVIPSGFTEDKWVQMAEVRPGNRALVHHVIAFVRAPGSKWLRDAAPGVPFVPKKRDRPAAETQKRQQRNEEGEGGGEFLVGFAPGVVPEILRPGQGKLIKAGSDFVFQLHYTANGKAGADRTRIGLVFAKEPPAERIYTAAVQNRKFEIPAGDPNYRVDAAVTIQEAATLTALLPHMHLRGKDFEYRIVYPTGESEVLLRVPKYSFNWQLSYYLSKPIALTKGTRIECTAHFDNSPNNPNNPNPAVAVRWGDQSWEEMMIGFFDLAFDARKNPESLFREKGGARSGD
jgi:hypothetical protein